MLDIVSDCNAVLERHQALFRRRTDIRDFAHYRTQLVCAVTKYVNNIPVILPSHLQLEDCMILGLSVLYRTAIFVLRKPQNEWCVYNQVNSHVLYIESNFTSRLVIIMFMLSSEWPPGFCDRPTTLITLKPIEYFWQLRHISPSTTLVQNFSF